MQEKRRVKPRRHKQSLMIAQGVEKIVPQKSIEGKESVSSAHQDARAARVAWYNSKVRFVVYHGRVDAESSGWGKGEILY